VVDDWGDIGVGIPAKDAARINARPVYKANQMVKKHEGFK
jgi:hypothetical protein